MMQSYSILVNTTDSFEDCWIPFFTLFKEYWQDFHGKIYLNTETKKFEFDGLDIISLQHNINTPSNNIMWGECLYRALDNIDSDIILYMQEDYFLKDHVKNDIVEKYVQMMQDDNDIHCIHLTDQGMAAEKPSAYDKLWTVPNKHQDRISCQAALWKKDVLKQYIRTYESGWSFEWWGSKRAAILKHNFFVVDKNWCKKDHFEIIPYIFTGIIGGRWINEVVPLFERHNILVNYNKRGFFLRKPIPLNKRITDKIMRLPIEFRSSVDLMILKLKTRK